MSYFDSIPAPVFRYYRPDEVILGKPMREHLPFAMA